MFLANAPLEIHCSIATIRMEKFYGGKFQTHTKDTLVKTKWRWKTRKKTQDLSGPPASEIQQSHLKKMMWIPQLHLKNLDGRPVLTF